LCHCPCRLKHRMPNWQPLLKRICHWYHWVYCRHASGYYNRHFRAMCPYSLYLKLCGPLSAFVQLLTSCSVESQLKQFASWLSIWSLHFCHFFILSLTLSFLTVVFFRCVFSFMRSYTLNIVYLKHFFNLHIIFALYNIILLHSSSCMSSMMCWTKATFLYDFYRWSLASRKCSAGWLLSVGYHLRLYNCVDYCVSSHCSIQLQILSSDGVWVIPRSDLFFERHESFRWSF